MTNICTNSYRSSGHKDETGKKIVMCLKTNKPCVAQRYCGDDKEYIVSENADRVCRYYNK